MSVSNSFKLNKKPAADAEKIKMTKDVDDDSEYQPTNIHQQLHLPTQPFVPDFNSGTVFSNNTSHTNYESIAANNPIVRNIQDGDDFESIYAGIFTKTVQEKRTDELIEKDHKSCQNLSNDDNDDKNGDVEVATLELQQSKSLQPTTTSDVDAKTSLNCSKRKIVSDSQSLDAHNPKTPIRGGVSSTCSFNPGISSSSSFTQAEISSIEDIIRKSVASSLTSLKVSENSTNISETPVTPVINLTLHIGCHNHNYFKDSDSAGRLALQQSPKRVKVIQQNKMSPIVTPVMNSLQIPPKLTLLTPQLKTAQPSQSLSSSSLGLFTPSPLLKQLKLNEANVSPVSVPASTPGTHNSTPDANSIHAHNSESENNDADIRNEDEDNSKRSEYANIKSCTINKNEAGVINVHFNSADLVPRDIINQQFTKIALKQGCAYSCNYNGCGVVLKHSQSTRRHWLLHYYKPTYQQQNGEENYSSVSVGDDDIDENTCSNNILTPTSTKNATPDSVLAKTAGTWTSQAKVKTKSQDQDEVKVKKQTPQTKARIKYACSICDAVLSRKDVFRRHMLLHNPSNPTNTNTVSASASSSWNTETKGDGVISIVDSESESGLNNSDSDNDDEEFRRSIGLTTNFTGHRNRNSDGNSRNSNGSRRRRDSVCKKLDLDDK